MSDGIAGHRDVSEGSDELVPLGDLLPGDSPRLAGENAEHCRTLAASDAELPPIVVHRASMRVVDGMHRLRAAGLRGEKRIEVRFFDGTSEDAFVLAVRMNVERHGLPLSLADRTAAAVRILDSHQEWSDRAIASVTGLSHKTVAAIRRRSSGENSQLSMRIGRDGRVRPVDVGDRRQRAGELMSTQPGASLREIARAVGISPGTARDVRDRLHRGLDPVLPTQHRIDAPVNRRWEPPDSPDDVGADTVGDTAIISALRGDPALRFSESGRVLLRLLDALTIRPRQWAWLVDAVPPHCAGKVVDAARRCAKAWLDFANRIETRYEPRWTDTRGD
ncbi:MAG TPA: ParB/RepB/Spo0J family partition protein [Actinophytocola sp.]|uniref:ParB/RepB/Spo0J family partition protein n=1 Tax=Actinophytocola sp. TaxID=1872138 RepID=UPI002DBCDB42|nr:ParB/RepB/Spo0J family partition protein [Actinophytocola sp.]HEU5473666.1 ParB/RepB/Spo0J family partition protein [Actinophytocola sp.]